jgi:hypothetical protein
MVSKLSAVLMTVFLQCENLQSILIAQNKLESPPPEIVQVLRHDLSCFMHNFQADLLESQEGTQAILQYMRTLREGEMYKRLDLREMNFAFFPREVTRPVKESCILLRPCTEPIMRFPLRFSAVSVMEVGDISTGVCPDRIVGPLPGQQQYPYGFSRYQAALRPDSLAAARELVEPAAQVLII